MKLSDLFGGGAVANPSIVATFTGVQTDTLLTSSPVIITSIFAGGYNTGPSNAGTYEYQYIVKNGTTVIYQGQAHPFYPSPIFTYPVMFADGIRVSLNNTPGTPYGGAALARFTIGYNLV